MSALKINCTNFDPLYVRDENNILMSIALGAGLLFVLQKVETSYNIYVLQNSLIETDVFM